MKPPDRLTLLRAAFIAGILAWPLFYHSDYAVSVMVIAGLNAMVAIGFSLLLGQAGQVSLGHATFFGLGAYSCALLTTRLDTPPIVGLAVGALISAIVAYAVGRPVLRLRGIMLVLVTLAMGEIFYILIRQARKFTGGLGGVGGIPWLEIGGFVVDSYIRQYYVTWILVLILLLFTQRAIRARPGRAMRALAVDEATASTLGIDIARWKLVAFLASAIYAALGGGLYAFVMTAINPDDFTFIVSMLILIIVMIGGIGSLYGAVAGSILMTWLVRSFSGFQEYSGSLYAIVLIVLVIFLPGGITGGIRPDQKEWLLRLLRSLRRDRAEPGVGQLTSPASMLAEEIQKAPASPHHSIGVEKAGRQLPATDDPLLRLDDVSVSFGGVRAVNRVSITVAHGTIASIIGPNGAGKTTLFNVISGLQRPDLGTIFFCDKDISGWRADQIARLGMARTFQTLHVFPNMTVLENVMTGRHRHEMSGFMAAGAGLGWQRREEQNARREAMRALRLVGMEGRAAWPVRALSYGQQRLVELARAIATEPTLLLLDEPAAGLNRAERIQLTERILEISASGVTVLLVEHDMAMAMGISEKVSVLDYGKLIAEGSPAEVQAHPAVVEAYLGLSYQSPAREKPAGPEIEPLKVDGDQASPRAVDQSPLLEAESLSTYYGPICAIEGVSLEVQHGEIVAVLGANGAGKTTLLRTISGLLRPRHGRVRYQGDEVQQLPPARIVALGIGHVPEGRHVFPTLSVRENLMMGAFLRRDEDDMASDLDFVLELFPALGDRLSQVAGTLSGGEQQMLAIGRALMGRPQLLLLDEPSMGLAPRLIEQVFQALVSLNQRGVTLLMVEQNAEMALSVADRAYVLQTGQVALSGKAADLRGDRRISGIYLGQDLARTERG